MRGEFYRKYGKRLFDFSLSLLGIVALSPLILAIAAAVKLSDQGPVWFSQLRVGKGFKEFRFLKFRTMVHGAAGSGPLVTSRSDPRITRIGSFLRRTKLDELPQLINVLKGDISLVGPRPEVPKYVGMFRIDYQEILSVRPGITDYAAIEFSDEEETVAKFADPEIGYLHEILPQKIQLYKKYISDMSFTLDVWLVLLTLFKIRRSL